MAFPYIVFFGEADEVGVDSFDSMKLIKTPDEFLKFILEDVVPAFYNDERAEMLETVCKEYNAGNIETFSESMLTPGMIDRVVELFHDANDQREEGDNAKLFIKSLTEFK